METVECTQVLIVLLYLYNSCSYAKSLQCIKRCDANDNICNLLVVRTDDCQRHFGVLRVLPEHFVDQIDRCDAQIVTLSDLTARVLHQGELDLKAITNHNHKANVR